MNIREMWLGFTDLELVQLAGEYGIADECDFNERFELINRDHVEDCITQLEFETAYPAEQESLDFYPEVEYN